MSNLLDSGQHDGISLDAVISHAKSGDLITWLDQQAGYQIASGFPASDLTFSRWYVQKIAENCTAMEGSERRKYGIQNRGLCLLISYTAEIIQSGTEDIRL